LLSEERCKMPELYKLHIRERHKEDVKKAIIESGFDLDDFVFRDTEIQKVNHLSRFEITVLYHEPSDSFFTFDYGGEDFSKPISKRKPGINSPTEVKRYFKDWQEQLDYLKEWLGLVREEISDEVTVSQNLDTEIIRALNQSGYDVAQICRNGHIINTQATINPQHNQRYCSRCGAECIFKCPSCNIFIKGEYLYNNASLNLRFILPAFCSPCGDAYPWTKLAIQTAKELADELDTLTDEDKAILKQSIDGIVKDTPQTKLAATRFAKLMVKGGKEVASIAKEILVDVISETAKKTIFPS
jgi:hypothetical protein